MTDLIVTSLLFLIPLFDLIVAVILWWSVREAEQPAPRTLVERAILATAIWLGVSIVAALYILRNIFEYQVDEDVRTLLFTLGILLPSAANVWWLVRFVTGWFGNDDEGERG